MGDGKRGRFGDGRMGGESMRSALLILRDYRQLLDLYKVERIRAVATSAVREARNGKDFLAEVDKISGLRLQIISGSEEASLIARGVLSSLQTEPGHLALVDIGGGSTEVSLVDSGKVTFGASVNLGSVRMTEMFCRSDPLLPGHERAMREHVRACLVVTLPEKIFGVCPRVVGSAGTIGALANYIRQRPSLPRTAGHVRTTFSVRELARASNSLRKMSLARRRRAPGIEERRAEIVVAGAVILEEICAHLKARTIKVVRRGLRDGLMLEEIARFAATQTGDATLPGPLIRVPRSRRLQPR